MGATRTARERRLNKKIINSNEMTIAIDVRSSLITPVRKAIICLEKSKLRFSVYFDFELFPSRRGLGANKLMIVLCAWIIDQVKRNARQGKSVITKSLALIDMSWQTEAITCMNYSKLLLPIHKNSHFLVSISPHQVSNGMEITISGHMWHRKVPRVWCVTRWAQSNIYASASRAE